MAASQCATPDGRDLSAALRERLIDLTVRTAARQSPYYSARFKELETGDQGPTIGSEALRGLPILERQDAVAAGSSIRSQVAKYGFSTYTSGTTGEPLIVDRSAQEQAYLRCYFGGTLKTKPDGHRVVLGLVGFFHGKQLQIPTHSMTVPVVLSGESGCRQALALLRRDFVVDGSPRRITAISGSVVDAQLLSAFLETEDLAEATEPVTTIKLTSHILTSSTARRLEEFWGCRVVDRYSLSEIFFGATQCTECGFHHFDSYGVAEIVKRDGTPVLDEGRGRLVLTSFYPFSQMTPFVRYAPGDVAEMCATGCRRGESFRLLGRESRSAFIGDGTYETLIGESEVLEALDPRPEIRRPRLLGVPSRLADVAGPPQFSWSKSDDSLELDVPICFPPWFHRERADSVADAIRRRLAEVSVPAQRLLADGCLAVRLSFGGDDANAEADALGNGDLLAPGF